MGGSLSLAEYIKRMNRVMNEDRAEMEVIPDLPGARRPVPAAVLILW